MSTPAPARTWSASIRPASGAGGPGARWRQTPLHDEVRPYFRQLELFGDDLEAGPFVQSARRDPGVAPDTSCPMLDRVCDERFEHLRAGTPATQARDGCHPADSP